MAASAVDFEQVTIGLDIGTTSVKAVAVDGDGTVHARARVPHPIGIPAADRYEHDVDRAWRQGVRAAFAEVAEGLGPVAVNVVAMVPSLAAVDGDGRALARGCSTATSTAVVPTARAGRPATSVSSWASCAGVAMRPRRRRGTGRRRPWRTERSAARGRWTASAP